MGTSVILLNLFDSNFAESPCSVAYQKSRYIEYRRGLLSFPGITLFTDEWINNPIVDEVQSRYKIGWLHEPYCLHPQTYEAAWLNRYKFDFILTYFTPLLRDDPAKFRLAPYAGTWLNQRDWGVKPKTKLCSMLIGSKMSTEGHLIRHKIADMIESEDIPVDLYGSRGTPVGYGQDTKYQVLADYAFSIVTETCREDNLFTEWLLDCFALGTVPIFWGAPNIGEFFNVDGIMQFDTTDRLYKILVGLNLHSWRIRLDAIWANLVKMGDYAVTEDWMYLNVLRELE